MFTLSTFLLGPRHTVPASRDAPSVVADDIEEADVWGDVWSVLPVRHLLRVGDELKFLLVRQVHCFRPVFFCKEECTIINTNKLIPHYTFACVIFQSDRAHFPKRRPYPDALSRTQVWVWYHRFQAEPN